MNSNSCLLSSSLGILYPLIQFYLAESNFVLYYHSTVAEEFLCNHGGIDQNGRAAGHLAKQRQRVRKRVKSHRNLSSNSFSTK
mmetsp:Transcript_22719/g.27868  ORF Transcript_22719/g.27868 Transcript_22719/m.27868 type:complete len:83 (-) Transcript_22719:2859-3107(-)